ncbi:hypothetical protein STRDD11_00078 [Streptococcus sp. DD11]|nr:DUF6612 family protein [Streptococcus sp. DD11]KXT86040.1 hypothetical protein STRDD11_00078 [Streptococcus sp. DD11]
MKLKVDLSITVDGSTKHQTMDGSLLYDKQSKELDKGALILRETADGQQSYQEMIMSGGQDMPVYSRDSEKGTWSKELTEGTARYFVRPDYFRLLEGLYSMADDVSMKESGSDYVFTLKSKNTDIIGLFGDEFSLELSGVAQSEMDKTLEVHLNKETLYLSDFKMDLSYSGEKGSLKTKIANRFSDWNKLADDAITAPD